MGFWTLGGRRFSILEVRSWRLEIRRSFNSLKREFILESMREVRLERITSPPIPLSFARRGGVGGEVEGGCSNVIILGSPDGKKSEVIFFMSEMEKAMSETVKGNCGSEKLGIRDWKFGSSGNSGKRIESANKFSAG